MTLLSTLLFSALLPLFAATNADSIPAGVSETEMVLKNNAIELPGTFTMPADCKDKVPAVVFVAGSGPNDRDETIGPNKPFRDLSWMLAKQGIASLRYDKRTKVYGARTQEVSGGTLDYDSEVTDDALAAVKWLATQKHVNADEIYVIGHSLGAMLAPRIAKKAEGGVKGIVALAAPGRNLWDSALEQLEYVCTVQGATPEIAKKQASILLAQMKRSVPRDYELQAANYDQIEEAKTLKNVKMMFLFGGNDYQVTVTDFSLWQAAFFMRPEVKFILLPELDHLMRPLTRKAVPQDYFNKGEFDGRVTELITDFILGKQEK
ncbi:MAG: alpha/beta hydrolase family protein [Alloprevotella sp.]